MNEQDFLNVIEGSPHDPTPRLVYADWLDEQGDPRGELLRIQEELRHIQVHNRAAKEARMHELLTEGVEPLIITRTNSIGMEFVLIFPGEFLMGSSKKDKLREWHEDQFSISMTEPFYLGRFPVTQSNWVQVMGTRPWFGNEYVGKGQSLPATFVSWSEATEFCTQLGRRYESSSDGWTYKLPTESEWEYACRAGTTTPFSFGDDVSQMDRYCWFDGEDSDPGEKIAPGSGLLLPNPSGFYDMNGNIWEWCQDWFLRRSSEGEVDSDVVDPATSRVRKGGSWFESYDRCRSASRDFSSPEWRIVDVGFRVAAIPATST